MGAQVTAITLAGAGVLTMVSVATDNRLGTLGAFSFSFPASAMTACFQSVMQNQDVGTCTKTAVMAAYFFGMTALTAATVIHFNVSVLDVTDLLGCSAIAAVSVSVLVKAKKAASSFT